MTVLWKLKHMTVFYLLLILVISPPDSSIGDVLLYFETAFVCFQGVVLKVEGMSFSNSLNEESSVWSTFDRASYTFSKMV